MMNFLIIAAIVLEGVTGDRIAARAAFDANNVRVGDPMALVLEFRGAADRDLHPPELSRAVDGSVWKIDDASAKTQTGENGRILTYRVRPLREGLHWFPSLEFAWEGGAAATKPIPVHVRQGVQAALSGLDESIDALPMPDGLLLEVKSRPMNEDEAFAWRKACARPSAENFAKFDFAEARLNEAACHVLDGNWAKAMKLYCRLEWSIGQNKTIERGIVAALARKNGDGAQELPAWRVAFRCVLKHAWPGRAGIVGGLLCVLALLFWACGRAIRRLAAVAFALAFAGGEAVAQSPFDQFDRLHRQMMEQMEEMMNFGTGSSFSIGSGGNMKTRMIINGKEVEPPKIEASVAMSTNDVQIGQAFDFILSIEAPKNVEITSVGFRPDEMFGMVIGQGQSLADGKSGNPSNHVVRAAFPVRYDVPFKGKMGFEVSGQFAIRQHGFMGGLSMPFSVVAPQIPVEIKPLPTENQPPDFCGAIGTGFALKQTADRVKVATNDVVKIRCDLVYDGYMPPDAVEDVVSRRGAHQVSWQKYFVAVGSEVVPPATLVYYDTKAREYRRIRSAPVRLSYVPDEEAQAEAVAVDTSGKSADGKTVTLRFAPSESAPVVDKPLISPESAPLAATERRGAWVRVDSGRHAGWMKSDEE